MSVCLKYKDYDSVKLRFRSLERSMSRMSTMSDTSLNHGIVAYYKNNPVYLKYLNTEIKQFNVTDDVILEFKQVGTTTIRVFLNDIDIL